MMFCMSQLNDLVRFVMKYLKYIKIFTIFFRNQDKLNVVNLKNSIRVLMTTFN